MSDCRWPKMTVRFHILLRIGMLSGSREFEIGHEGGPLLDAGRQLGGRAVPSNEVLVRLLTAVDGRGGKITLPALARAIEYPPLRLRTLLAVAQRVLNIDGYSVLTRDDASDTIELDRNLLCLQFDLVVGDK